MTDIEAFRKRLDAVEKLRPIARKYDKMLTQLAINWNLCRPGVTTALVGAKRSAQVRENAGGAGWRIDREDLGEIEETVAGLTDLE